jgi:hypothetical protein
VIKIRIQGQFTDNHRIFDPFIESRTKNIDRASSQVSRFRQPQPTKDDPSWKDIFIGLKNGPYRRKPSR